MDRFLTVYKRPLQSLLIIAIGFSAAPLTFSQPFLPLQPGMGVATCSTVPNFIENRPPGEFVIGILDLRNPPANRIGRNWNAPMYHGPNDSWTAENLGQVFGVCFDEDGNIYTTTTTSYGTEPGLTRLIGPGGPGAIYKLDGQTGAISTFAQLPNSGPGLGNICFDRRNQQLFVTNFEDGKIYRLSLGGTILDSFDPHQPDDGSDGFAPRGERPWGVGVYKNRVYYGVWWEHYRQNIAGTANEVRSVGLNGAGEFTNDDRQEVRLPSLNRQNYSEPVSDIAFAPDGRMLLAERSMENNTDPRYHDARVLEYREVAGAWTFEQKFNIGNLDYFGDHDNSAGGVDFGYSGFNQATQEVTGCEETVWSTGDALRFPGYNPDNGDDYVYGLARMPATGNTANNVASTSYYVDLDGSVSYIDKTLVGDIEIYRKSCLLPTSGIDSICLFDSTTLTVPSGFEYRWSPPDGLNCTDCQTPTASPTITTTYTVEVFSNTGEAIPHTRRVIVRDCRPPTFDSASICVRDSVTLTVPDGLAYSWTPAAGLSCTDCREPIASPQQTTRYTCEVTSITTDIIVHNRVITVRDCGPPTVDSVRICQYDAVPLSVPEGVAYRWAPAAGLSCTDCREPIASPQQSTSYICEVISITGDTIRHRRTVSVQPSAEYVVNIRAVLSATQHDIVTLPVRVDPAPDSLRATTFIATITYSDTTLLLRDNSAADLQRMLVGLTKNGWEVEVLESYRGFFQARFTATSPAEYLRDTGTLFHLVFRQIIANYSQESLVNVSIEFPGNECLRIQEAQDTIPKTICGLETRLIEWALQKYAVDVRSTSTSRQTQINLSLAFDGRVRAEIFNVLGSCVGVLVDDELRAGQHQILWHTQEVPLGIYFLRVTSGSWMQTQKLRVAE